jgi:hypothetical protein
LKFFHEINKIINKRYHNQRRAKRRGKKKAHAFLFSRFNLKGKEKGKGGRK